MFAFKSSVRTFWGTQTEKTLLWFRNDLRLADNPCVDFAMRKSSTLLPVYCFDPRCFEEDERELSRTSM